VLIAGLYRGPTDHEANLRSAESCTNKALRIGLEHPHALGCRARVQAFLHWRLQNASSSKVVWSAAPSVCPQAFMVDMARPQQTDQNGKALPSGSNLDHVYCGAATVHWD